MEKVDFTFKRGGRTKQIAEKQAQLLQRAGMGTYLTRDMVAARGAVLPNSQQIQEPEAPKPPLVMGVADELDALDKDQLHALAKERGVKVHHMAGADKVRTALREAP